MTYTEEFFRWKLLLMQIGLIASAIYIVIVVILAYLEWRERR